MAFGKMKRKDLDPEFLQYVTEKWEKYERADKKAKQYDGTTKALFWKHVAYRYRQDYDIAMAAYDERVKKWGGVKLELE